MEIKEIRKLVKNANKRFNKSVRRAKLWMK